MSELKKIGSWIYYFDGSGGEFYGKATQEEMEEFLDKEQAGDEPAPFKICIPDSDGLQVYLPNEQYPERHISFGEVRSAYAEELGDDAEELSDEEVLEMALEAAAEV